MLTRRDRLILARVLLAIAGAMMTAAQIMPGGFRQMWKVAPDRLKAALTLGGDNDFVIVVGLVAGVWLFLLALPFLTIVFTRSRALLWTARIMTMAILLPVMFHYISELSNILGSSLGLAGGGVAGISLCLMTTGMFLVPPPAHA